MPDAAISVLGMDRTVLLEEHTRRAVAASTPVDARIEVLAMFADAAEMADSTIALDQAVSRPVGDDSAIAADAPVDVGVTGLGIVPAEDVRAVHVTQTTDASRAATLTVDGQSPPVYEGRSVLSTIVTPTADGSIGITADNDVSVRLDVRGYVAEAAQYASSNGPGAFWTRVHSGADHLRGIFIRLGVRSRVELPGGALRGRS